MFRKIKSDADRQQLCFEKWQMLLNFGKCMCLHMGHGNEDAQYTMGGNVLKCNTTVKEKDF